VIGAIGACFIFLTGIKVANREGLKIGQEAMDDRIEACAVPWGIEAFTREYAKHAGLSVEDPDELRRRLPSAAPGRPQMAWHGDLGGGTLGHLSVWIDPSDSPAPPRFRLTAVLANRVEVDGRYEIEEAGEVFIVSTGVDAIGRAANRLDDLREQVSGGRSSMRANSHRTSARAASRVLDTATIN